MPEEEVELPPPAPRNKNSRGRGRKSSGKLGWKSRTGSTKNWFLRVEFFRIVSLLAYRFFYLRYN